MASEAQIDALLAAADRAEPKLAAALRRWFARLGTQEPADIGMPDTQALADAIRPILAALFAEGAALAAADLPEARIGISFKLPDPDAVNAANRVVGDLVTQITTATRDGIRASVRTGIAKGYGMPDIARLIRPLIGLNGPQATAVTNYQAGLAAKVSAGTMTALQAAKMSGTYAARLHRYRATVIARTETMRAVNAGRQYGWQKARQDGLLIGDWQRIWIVTRDDRTCPICRPLLRHPPVGLDEPFMTSIGPVFLPPLHPQCRCTTALQDSLSEPLSVA